MCAHHPLATMAVAIHNQIAWTGWPVPIAPTCTYMTALTLWTWEATIVAQNNYSALYHVAQEAIIMAQRSIHVFSPLRGCIFLYRLLFASQDCLNVWVGYLVGQRLKQVCNKHITDSPLRRYKWTTTIACTLLHTLWIPRFSCSKEAPLVYGQAHVRFHRTNSRLHAQATYSNLEKKTLQAVTHDLIIQHCGWIQPKLFSVGKVLKACIL